MKGTAGGGKKLIVEYPQEWGFDPESVEPVLLDREVVIIPIEEARQR